MGTFNNIEKDVLNYANGDKCNEVPRVAEITVECGSERSLVSITEVTACVYVLVATIPCRPCGKFVINEIYCLWCRLSPVETKIEAKKGIKKPRMPF